MNHAIHACSEQDLPVIYGNLRRFNHSRIPFTQEEPFCDLSRKILDEDGNIIAGCIAEMYCWKVVFVDILWVDERYRHQGLGSRLLGAVEAAARQEGCTLIHLDSFSWQARDFYVRLGYEVFGVLEDCPEGQCRYFLKKKLTPTLDYVDLFHHIQPGFFQKDYIRALPPEHIFHEQMLRLADYSPTALAIPAPEGIFYGVYTGDHATLLAAVCTRRLRHHIRAASMMPVLFNGIIVGAVVHFGYAPAIPLPLCMLFVAAGEAVSCMLLGPLLLRMLSRLPHELFES